MSAVSSLAPTLGQPEPRKLHAVPKRDPALVVLFGLLKTLLPAVVGLWAKARSAVLVLGGLGFLCWAAWTVAPAFGMAAIGASLLIWDLLGRRE